MQYSKYLCANQCHRGIYYAAEPEGGAGKDADVADLVEQISTLVSQLLDANDRTDKPVPIAGVCVGRGGGG